MVSYFYMPEHKLFNKEIPKDTPIHPNLTSSTYQSTTPINMVKLCDGICEYYCKEQGKSEGFDSCHRPSNKYNSNWNQIVDFSVRVTLKFDGWPPKIIGHLFYTTSSFVEFKLELQSRNIQFGSKSAIFCPMWPWNLLDDLEKQ